jgi:PAS domain S-box-containing protein
MNTSEKYEPPACCDCKALVDDLSAQISDLMQENLRCLDEAMQRNNSLFEGLLANSSAGITLTGPDRRIVRVVHGLTGLSSVDLTGTLVESLAVPEDQELIVGWYKMLLSRSCRQVKREIRVPRADGIIRWFAVTVTDMLDDPNVQGIVWNYLDITEQKLLGRSESS